MQTTFARSLRGLSRQRAGLWLPLAATGLLAAWAAWLACARVTIYAVSDTARLEVEQAVCPVEAGLDGRVTATFVRLDTDVPAGAPLVVLDATPLQLEREELLAARASRHASLQPLGEEIAALERQLADLRQAVDGGSAELVAARRETEAALRIADAAVHRSQQLGADLVANAELERARAEVDKLRAGLERQRAMQQRTDAERRAAAHELQAELAACQQRLVTAMGECAVADAKLARLTHEIERRTIRSPIAGRVGEIADLRPGQAVGPNTRVAAIVPAGTLRIVATFGPADALGRVRIGQPARLRLHGFPWTEYGFVEARVTRLGSEALSGAVRVEAAIANDAPFPLALQHGWPGALEVEVERVAPATLVLRAAGALLAAPRRATAGAAEVR